MEKEESVREAAQAIRPYLESLVGRQTAARLDAALARLLDASGETDQLLAELQSTTPTSQWWLDFLRCGAMPPEDARVAATTRAGLPGLGLPVLPRYACPRGDYVWYRRSPAVELPSCPTHNVPLRSEPRAV